MGQVPANLNDRAYLVAGLEQEVDHYALLRAVGGPDLTGTKFYFPVGMFTNYATTVNTLLRWKTPLSPPTSLVCATSPRPPSVSMRRKSWESRPNTAPSPA